MHRLGLLELVSSVKKSSPSAVGCPGGFNENCPNLVHRSLPSIRSATRLTPMKCKNKGSRICVDAWYLRKSPRQVLRIFTNTTVLHPCPQREFVLCNTICLGAKEQVIKALCTEPRLFTDELMPMCDA